MRLDEFARALPLLPPVLRQRAEELRRHLSSRRCERCQQVSDAVQLALMAARYDELAATARLIETAEQLVADHGPARAGWCSLPGDWPATSAARGIVARWARVPADLVAATDASWKDRAAGIAYVVSDGRFGLRGRLTDRQDPTGPSRVLVSELRAVEFLLSGCTDQAARMTVLVDSTAALSCLHRWRTGETAAMPAGYDLRRRARGVQPTLVRLAEQVATLPNVAFQHVRGHTGHCLNEAADALSSMARRRLREKFDHRTRARELVDAFLRDWHAAGSRSGDHGSR